MEALTAVSVALLTVYDMAKGMDRGMEIGQIVLAEKSGGASGQFLRSSGTGPAPELPARPLRCRRGGWSTATGCHIDRECS